MEGFDQQFIYVTRFAHHWAVPTDAVLNIHQNIILIPPYSKHEIKIAKCLCLKIQIHDLAKVDILSPLLGWVLRGSFI